MGLGHDHSRSGWRCLFAGARIGSNGNALAYQIRDRARDSPFAYLERSREREREAERENPVTAKSRVKLGPNGEAMLALDQETQKRVALKAELVAPTKMSPELKGYGRAELANVNTLF